MKTVLAVGVLLVFTAAAYAKWLRYFAVDAAEELWHSAFDALLNP